MSTRVLKGKGMLDKSFRSKRRCLSQPVCQRCLQILLSSNLDGWQKLYFIQVETAARRSIEPGLPESISVSAWVKTLGFIFCKSRKTIFVSSALNL